MFLLGYDVGSSSVKATLLDAETGRVVAFATSPDNEMEIIAHQAGWAEQHPQVWWENVKIVTAKIKLQAEIDIAEIKAIGISYQMHGLVVVGKKHEILRPSIIWCDSRAVGIGKKAALDIGKELCLEHLLNYPGNFTISKLKWVMENEPEIYSKIYKVMLPGDYIAMKMSDKIQTTCSGLSEGILWDFKTQELANIVLNYYEISSELIPQVVSTFTIQGELTEKAALELGLKSGTKIAYRAGDQPNNALSLNVLNPGEIAATAGTSGVIYGIDDKTNYDPKSRVNTFIHVNHTAENPRYGVLLCVNGCAILYRWLKHNFLGFSRNSGAYDRMNMLALQAPAGSRDLIILPYGNGAERTLENKNIGASIHGLNFNIHNISHFLRASQEGIVFALNYGLEIMKNMGIEITTVRAGDANLFLSPIFGEIFATTTGVRLELFNTDGSQGAARGAGIGVGVYKDIQEAFVGLESTKVIEPDKSQITIYQELYEKWYNLLKIQIEKG